MPPRDPPSRKRRNLRHASQPLAMNALNGAVINCQGRPTSAAGRLVNGPGANSLTNSKVVHIIFVSVGRAVFRRLAFGATRTPAGLFFGEKDRMYLLYVDESGDPGVAGSRFLILGAAAVFEGKWLPVEREIRTLIDRYFPAGPKPLEIHLSDLRKGKKGFRRLTRTQRDSLVNDFCQLALGLLSTELVMFAVIADKPTWFANNPTKTGDDLYAEMFEDLSSRFDLFLRRRYAENAPSKGIIIADPHKPSLSEALRTNQRVYQRQGHRWDILYNLVETVFFLASNDSPGIQLADLASHAVWRLVSANEDHLARLIGPIFDRESPTSRINPGKWHGVKYLGNDSAIRGAWRTSGRKPHVTSSCRRSPPRRSRIPAPPPCPRNSCCGPRWPDRSPAPADSSSSPPAPAAARFPAVPCRPSRPP